MKELEIRMNPNPLVQFLKKPAAEFTRQDIIYFIEENEIEMINFRYVGEDGKLKSLNFVINSKQHLEDLLSTGERVDGSSLFSFIEAPKKGFKNLKRHLQWLDLLLHCL